MTTIVGIKTSNRIDNAAAVQQVLTKYGCIIKTRIGLHETKYGQCSFCGIILLEITNDNQSEDLIKDLCEIEQIEIQQMKF